MWAAQLFFFLKNLLFMTATTLKQGGNWEILPRLFKIKGTSLKYQ